jgi:(p)ppGpp synthase/HD superfamily hydrolase
MPMTSELVLRARALALRAHRTQRRKANGSPYFTHLEAVAALLDAHGYDDDVSLAVAYLHDLLEDQPAHAHELVTTMPASVVSSVKVLSEQKTDGAGMRLPKKERFNGYLAGLSAESDVVARALPVSCADRIHNTLSVVEDQARGLDPFSYLSSQPSDVMQQLAALRRLYVRQVREPLLTSFDRAVELLQLTVANLGTDKS